MDTPSNRELLDLMGESSFSLWLAIDAYIREYYEIEGVWSKGGKKWAYELKFRKGGKTLCGLYTNQGEAGLMIIFGKEERARFEELRHLFSPGIQSFYDEAHTYHDGKWVMFSLCEESLPISFPSLLAIKRKPAKP